MQSVLCIKRTSGRSRKAGQGGSSWARGLKLGKEAQATASLPCKSIPQQTSTCSGRLQAPKARQPPHP
eukprot:1161208-Pelagomonas_calceolata.AAC.9